jgi:hypothetical protein
MKNVDWDQTRKEVFMLELEHNGYYPLTREHLREYVPAEPGIFMLAVRLVNGVHKTFFTSQSDNLYRSLQSISRKEWAHLTPVVREHLEKFQCYFTFFVLLKPEYNDDDVKMLSQTSGPVVRLKVVNCN